MEPASIVSIVATTLTLVVRTSKSLKDFIGRYRSVDQDISMIIVKLNTMGATISQLESWLKSEHDVDGQFLTDLRTATGAVEFVVGQIEKSISKTIKAGYLGGKLRHLWNSDQLSQHQRTLDSQTAALGVLLSVAVLKSHTQQRSVLESTDGRRVLQAAQDQASIYACYPDDIEPEEKKRKESIDPGSATANLASFEFDDQLIHSEIYRLALKARPTLQEPLPTGKGKGKELDLGSPTESSSGTASDSRTIITISDTSSSSFSDTRSIVSVPRQKRWKAPGSNNDRSRLTNELCQAVARGVTALTETLCDNGADPNCRLQSVSLSTEKGPVREVKSLLGKLVRETYGTSEPTLLHHAAEKGYLEIIKSLTSHGANANARAKGGKTPLHLAHDDAAGILLAAGADPFRKDDFGAVPLHYMAASGNLKASKALAQASTTANSINKLQQTPLHLACMQGHHDVVLTLLEAGAFADASDAEGLMPLHYASIHGHYRIVRTLLKAGVDPDAPSKSSWRPLHYAAGEGHVKIVRALIASGVNIETPAAGKMRPLHIAAEQWRKDVVGLLLAASADIDAENEQGQRPLHLALGTNRVELVELLLESGATVNAKTKEGNTALLQACLSQGPAQDAVSMVQVLLEFGAKINTRNNLKQTPLGAACIRSQSALVIVRLLLRRGAKVNYEDYVSLWRNQALPAWEKKAVHKALDEVADPALRKDEVEWLLLAL